MELSSSDRTGVAVAGSSPPMSLLTQADRHGLRGGGTALGGLLHHDQLAAVSLRATYLPELAVRPLDLRLHLVQMEAEEARHLACRARGRAGERIGQRVRGWVGAWARARVRRRGGDVDSRGCRRGGGAAVNRAVGERVVAEEARGGGVAHALCRRIDAPECAVR